MFTQVNFAKYTHIYVSKRKSTGSDTQNAKKPAYASHSRQIAINSPPDRPGFPTHPVTFDDRDGRRLRRRID